MFEKTTIQQNGHSNSKEPYSYDSKEFQKCHIKFNQCYLEKLIKLKPNFEFEDLKGPGDGMNGVLLPGKEGKLAPLKDLVSICAPPTDFQNFLHPYKKEWEFSIELDGKVFVGEGENRNQARNVAALKCLNQSGFEI